MLDLAQQADLVIGIAPCVGRSPSVQGRMTLQQGLDRILAGSNCRYRIIDGATVQVFVARSLSSDVRPVPAAASAVKADAPVEVDEVQITGAKRTGLTGQFVGAATVVGADQIRETGVDTAQSLQRQISSLTVTNLGAGRDKILLRGLSDGAFTGRTQSTVATYLDNVPINYNAPDPDLRLTDVKGVEILFGPQGALYGGGSLSGVYRIVPREPVAGETSLRMTGQASLTEGGAPSGAIDAVANLAVADDGALRLAMFTERRGGYLNNDELRLNNVDLTTRVGGRLSFGKPLNHAWDILLSTTFQSLRSSDTQYVVGPRRSLRRANQVREASQNDLVQSSILLRGSGDWGRVQSTTAYVKHDFSSRYDASAVLDAFESDGAELGLFDELSSIRMLVNDSFWVSPPLGRGRLLGGVFVSSTREASPSELKSTDRSGRLVPRYSEQRLDRLTEAALYGEMAVDLENRITIAAGTRLFATRVHTLSQVVAPAPGQSRETDQAETFHGVAPQISVRKGYGSGDFFYLLASSGYRAGGFNTGGLAPPPMARRRFEPDRLINYEAGGEISPFSDRLKIRIATFYDLWTNIQTDQYLPSGLAYTANVGDGRNFGIEAEVAYIPSERMTIQVTSLLGSPKITRSTTGMDRRTRLPGVSDFSATALMAYRRPLGGQRSMTVTAEAAYVGRSSLTFDPRFSPVTPGYYTSNVSAQVYTGQYSLGLYVSNLFNTSNDTFAYGNPFSFGQVRQVTPQRPRTLTLSLTRSN